MNFANAVKIEQKTDHFLIRFQVTTEDSTADVALIAVPLLVGIELSLDLFKGMIGSIMQLQISLGGIQERINNLNTLVADAQKAQQQAAAQQVKK